MSLEEKVYEHTIKDLRETLIFTRTFSVVSIIGAIASNNYKHLCAPFQELSLEETSLDID